MPPTDNNQAVCRDGEDRRCVYCGNVAQVVWVHGHGQCASCGINVEECCRGEQCRTES